MDMPDLGKQVGPLPLGAWIVVVGGSLGYLVYSRSRTPAGPVEVAAGPDAGVGVGGVGAVGAYVPTDGGMDTPASTVTGPETNQQWGMAAFNWLVGQGTDGATADTAIRQYLSGNSLSLQQNGLISQVLSKFGMTPEDLPAAPPIPHVTPPKPAPKPAPRKPAPVPSRHPVPQPVHHVVHKPAPVPKPKPAPAHYYTVKHGDTLSGIAARYPSAAITWRTIFNANRGVISNPNLIHAGQRLVIR
jgi:nucleoid-associated protein YgaU